MTAMDKAKQTARYDSDDDRWTAVTNRDHSAEGHFYFSVLTTGIYCRPGCPARLPRRENVRFHIDCAAAEAAGFRACKRCQPRLASIAEQYSAIVAKACRLIETAETPPSLATLAIAAGMSPFHFHRIFKSVTGITPKAYVTAHRTAQIRNALPHSSTVTEAIYNAGYNGNERFYATSAAVLGMKPTSYRRGGAGVSIRFALAECSLGSVLVAATDKGVCAILIGDEHELLRHDLEVRFPQAQLIGADKDFAQWIAKVVGLIEMPAIGMTLPLDVRGTAFQQRVWQALQDIPPGSTLSYTQVAERIGVAKKSVRAVAQAIAANPVAVAIPCHRVVRSDGALAGYRWGIERKRILLEREASTVKNDC